MMPASGSLGASLAMPVEATVHHEHHITPEGAQALMAVGYPASALGDLFAETRRSSGARYAVARPR